MIIELSQARQWRADLARHGKNAALSARGKVLLDTLRDETMAAKKCAFCGIEFIGRKDARFCSDVHRAAANRRKDERGPSELAEKLRSAAQADDLYVASIGSFDAGKHKRARNVALHEAHAAIVAELGQEQEPNASRTEVDAPVVTTVDAVDAVQEQEPNASTSDDVRAKLRAFIAETSFSQKKIARLAGTSQPTISQFLAGKTDGSPSFRQSILDVVDQDHGLDRR